MTNYTIDKLRELIIHDLVATPADRRYSSPEHPLPEAKGDEFYSECISTIVAEVLNTLGYDRIDGFGRNRGQVFYGKKKPPHYIRIKWKLAADLFSPIRDISEEATPLFHPRYIYKYDHAP